MKGFIFDLDGTLVDTNDLHTQAWQEAMADYGYEVAWDRVAVEIGKGGTMLVPSVLGEEAEQAHGDALRDRHDERYLDLVDAEGAKTFPDVVALFETLKARGVRTAVATAAKRESLERVVEAAGLDLFGLADAVVTDSDVERSKPHPDVVQAAVRKLGLDPAQCVMLGDTPYDLAAAGQAGVVGLGVLTGVHDQATLQQAGARVVYTGLPDLMARLDDVLEGEAVTR